MIGGQHHHAGAWHRIVVKGWGHQGSDQVDEVHSHVYKGWDHLSMCPSCEGHPGIHHKRQSGTQRTGDCLVTVD